jgi:TrmH family RNA methyltransferase
MAKRSTSAHLSPLRVVLVSVRNPLNIGAAARAMSNFGFSDLRVVNPYHIAFREAQSAVGAGELLRRAQEYESLAEAVADCTLVVGTTAARHRKLVHELRSLDAGASIVQRELSIGRVALLFGSEKRGLSNEDLSLCHWLMRIPTGEDHPAMNLGQAVAVCLYELHRGPKPRISSASVSAATAAELNRFSDLLLEALRVSGYAKPRDFALEQKIRRLVVRLNLSAPDLELWLGMLRQLLWKMESSR